MLYKLSYYFFGILQFFSEMLKQKKSRVVLFLVPVFIQTESFGGRKG